jgi:uncharacterized protein (DUF2384 family)
VNTSDINQTSELFGVEPEIMKLIINNELDRQHEKLNEAMKFAIDYFSTKKRARAWFTTMNLGLGLVTPLSLLDTDAGFDLVKNSIIKLNQGMTS